MSDPAALDPRWLGLLCTGLGTAAFVLALARRAPLWVFLGIGAAPLLVLVRETLQLYSYHGLMHASLVYRIATVGLPPSDPFVAGGPLRYAWAHHALLAPLVSFLDVSPGEAFAVFNVVALVGTFVFLWWASGFLTGDRDARLLGVALAVYGVSPLANGPLSGWIPEPQVARLGALFPLAKALHVNNSQAGFLGFAGFLWLLLRTLADRGRPLVDALGLAFVVLAMALVYPFVWLPAVLLGGAAAVALAVRRRDPGWRPGLCVLGAIAAGSVVALPYLLSLQGGRSEPTLELALSGSHLRYTTLSTLLCVGPILALAAWLRTARAHSVPPHPIPPEGRWPRSDAWWVVVVAGALPAVMFLVCHAQDHAEHKFLSLTTIALGLAGGPALAALGHRSRALQVTALALILWPAYDHTVELATLRVPGAVPYETRRASLWPVDPGERALAAWMRQETHADAVFLDTHLEVALCGRRALYVPVTRAEMTRRTALLAGWGNLPPIMAQLSFGHAHSTLAARFQRQQGVLGAGMPAAPDEVLERIRRDVAGAPLYAVARSPAARGRLQRDPRFEGVFSAGAIAVFAVAPEAGRP